MPGTVMRTEKTLSYSKKRVLHGFVCKTLREEGKEINLTSRKKKLSSL